MPLALYATGPESFLRGFLTTVCEMTVNSRQGLINSCQTAIGGLYCEET